MNKRKTSILKKIKTKLEMTSLIIHVIAAFVLLMLLDRLFEFKIPLKYLFLISLFAILPDVIDKTLTGTRYPFHSLVVSGTILLLLNIILSYYIKSRASPSPNHLVIMKFIFLASIAFLSHSIMDLEGSIPIFYPLDLHGYRLDFHISIIQSFPPIFQDFPSSFIIIEPFDYSRTYDHEGSLLNTLDVLFVILILFVLFSKGLKYVKDRIKVINQKQIQP